MALVQSGSALLRDNIDTRNEGNIKQPVHETYFVQFPYFVPALSLPFSSLSSIIVLPEPHATVHSAHPYDDSATGHTWREDGEICWGRSRTGTAWA